MFTNDTQTLGHVHSSSLMLRLASHHLAAFLRLIVGTKTPLACRVAPAPAAAPARSSHHAPHRVRRCVLSKCITLSDSLARRTGGSDSPLMRLLTFASLLRCSLGPLGHDLPPASLLPPLKGRAVIAIERGSVSGRGRERQSDGYRTHQRTVARFVGRVQPKRSRPNRKPRGRVMVTRRGYGTHQRPVALCAWAGLA